MHRLIISIVPKNSAGIVTAAANGAGASGGSVLLGRGTASNSIIQLLGLGDTSKEVVLIVVDESLEKTVVDAVKTAVADKKHFGVIFSLAVPSFFRSGSMNDNETKTLINTGDENMAHTNDTSGTNSPIGTIGTNGTNGTNSANVSGAASTNNNESYEMINIIVNKGYAEDAMAAARKAGAGGGTILSARGTAKEGDEKFFGMEIVPEKEMLIVLVPSAKKTEILNAVKALPCFEKAGSGIVFSSEVESFSVLGK